MTSHDIRTLVDAFFSGLSLGEIDADMLTPEMTFWSVNSGVSERERFLQGIRVLATIAGKSLCYTVDTLIVDGQRAAAEVSSSGTLINGEGLQNKHVFIFTVSDGKISAVVEFMNQRVVEEKIMPLMMALGTGKK
ncbi:nuclear transport factor 2 family protein [Zhongshania aquimaris]|uniref:Nuclear transport factor 2 family protein n=1 Tax=Zhongshania aquimaris TaxID=2857107 RepID=A0ABS6VXS3_9GAMM|nr:nuclear transport factor 2 family protein [Zhongshania aquimaris]MBW2942490.1 nuclear transport factor 2 family protein [Zhongshania aquimaris]